MRPQIEEAIDRLRSALADSPACNWETLTDETGLSPSTLRPILQRLPENDWALRAFRSRRRAWQLQLRKEREKELAARLERHLREGGSFKSFAKKEGISRSKASGVYYRNLEHVVYKLSGLVDPFRGQDIEEVCRLAAKGLAQREIAARVGMTEDAVDSILDRYEGRKVPAMRLLRRGAQAKRAEEQRTQKRTELLKVANKVTRLVEKGFTLAEISQIMKEPYHVLYYKLRRVGELFRDRYPRHSVVRARKKAKKAPILESD